MTTPTLDDDRVDQVVHDWVRDDDERAPDRAEQVGRIMDHVDATKQRRRFWPLIPFGRRAMHSATGAEAPVESTSGAPIAALTPLRAIAAVAVLVVGGSLLLYSATVAPAPAQLPGGLPVDLADEALFERMSALWAGGATDLSAVADVYAPDAVHTVLWQDGVERFSGSVSIGARIKVSRDLRGQEPQRTRLTDAASGEHRYLTVSSQVGGMPCAIWIENERIMRHDCILPMISGVVLPVFGSVAADAHVKREALMALIVEGWHGDREVLEQAVSPDIIHKVAYNNHDVTHRGVDAYWSVANQALAPPEALIPNIDLPAPEDELRWTDFSDVGGGSLCTFWARDDQIIRHDCIVPTRSY